ncbi:transposase [Streptomyces sp900105755]|uniref:Transposase n=1 Tax=Streptomyces sp. 900105755 TaxID=3154389 RepID=A0ABV1T972_9ACTN
MSEARRYPQLRAATGSIGCPRPSRRSADEVVAAIGDPIRFPNGKAFRSYTGLVPKASETGDTDRKGQPMSNAGSSLLRTTLIRADSARHQAPQLARIYYVQRSSAARTSSVHSSWSQPTSPNASEP